MVSKRSVTEIDTYRNQRRRVKNVHWVLIPVFLVTCLFAGYFFAISGFFALDKVIILGNSKVTDEDIINLAHLDKGINLFTVEQDVIQECLPIEPRIKSARMERKMPGTIKIIITEREAVALLNVGQAVVEIDEEGRILDRYYEVYGQALPLITGADTKGQGLVPGCYLSGEQIDKALEVLISLPEEADDIGEVNVADPLSIKLYTISGIEIRLGDSGNMEEKYLLCSTIIKENESKTGPSFKYIDVSIVGKPVFAYE